MIKRNFQHRAQTFGFETDDPWALTTLRLIFGVPRAYAPLVDAWERRFPGTRKNLDRLVADGWVTYQGPIIRDTRTGLSSDRRSRPIARYRTTTKGKSLVEAMSEDIRELEVLFPRLTKVNTKKLARLLSAYDLKDAHAKLGISVSHAVSLAGLPERSGRWWTSKLTTLGYLRELAPLADVRELVPEHWCVTRNLCRQVIDIIEAYPATAPASMVTEFRLRRSRFNETIDPARVGIVGATDFDHDVTAQRILAHLMSSKHMDLAGLFTVEPRIMVELNDTSGIFKFERGATGRLAYQPDAEIREKVGNSARRCVIEYERHQSRADAWSHIERFAGYLHTSTFPFERAVLRFVVDTEKRAASYVELIEAFATHALSNPELMPANEITLAVTSLPHLLELHDPLDDRNWHHVVLPRGDSQGAETKRRPVLHSEKDSPYWNYFQKGAAK